MRRGDVEAGNVGWGELAHWLGMSPAPRISATKPLQQALIQPSEAPPCPAQPSSQLPAQPQGAPPWWWTARRHPCRTAPPLLPVRYRAVSSGRTPAGASIVTGVPSSGRVGQGTNNVSRATATPADQPPNANIWHNWARVDQLAPGMWSCHASSSRSGEPRTSSKGVGVVSSLTALMCFCGLYSACHMPPSLRNSCTATRTHQGQVRILSVSWSPGRAAIVDGSARPCRPAASSLPAA